MKISKKKMVEVDAKTLKIHLKVSDGFCASLVDEEDKELKSYDGYVPDFMPGKHYGDYVILDIDIDSGMVTNWKKPTVEQIEKFISADED